ncbi:uncharacterized protein [Heterodontus francisci]|uniref:uncharacterized protein n=1 Tax=Heterodontus francisci TaxID=7792 RepID=UPI00355B3059
MCAPSKRRLVRGVLRCAHTGGIKDPNFDEDTGERMNPDGGTGRAQGIKSNGEDEEIKFSVSPVTDCEKPREAELCRSSEDAEITSHPWKRSCKQAWDSSSEFHQLHPNLVTQETQMTQSNWTCSVSKFKTEGTCPSGSVKDEESCPLGRVTEGSCPLASVKDEGSCPLGPVKDKGSCPSGSVKDEESCPLGRVTEGSCPLASVKDEGSCPSDSVKDEGSCPSGRVRDEGSCTSGSVKDEESCPQGQVKDEGLCPMDSVKDEGTCPLGSVKDEGTCPLGRVKDEGSCPHDHGPSPLHWMWEGFSVDRYAPRRRPEALNDRGSKFNRSGLFQISRQPEGWTGRQQQCKGRPRTVESPKTCRRAPIRQCVSLPCDTKAAARGKEGRAKARGSPAGRQKVVGPEWGACAVGVSLNTSPSNSPRVVMATDRESPAQPQNGCRPKGLQRAPAAYREFLRQYRMILEALPGHCCAREGEGDVQQGFRLRRKTSEVQLKVTKLVEQRHEHIRKTIMEKERKELMEQRKLKKERAKRRKIERQIAARMSVCEMDKWRKNQARERLQCYRKYNREQAAQYQAELREMKERVARAPFLFEQVIQNNVRGTINRLFSKVLQKLQLNEELLCKFSTTDCGSDVSLTELEAETDDWEGVCPLSQGEHQGHAACEEPLNTTGCECNDECSSTYSSRNDPAIDG